MNKRAAEAYLDEAAKAARSLRRRPEKKAPKKTPQKKKPLKKAPRTAKRTNEQIWDDWTEANKHRSNKKQREVQAVLKAITNKGRIELDPFAFSEAYFLAGREGSFTTGKKGWGLSIPRIGQIRLIQTADGHRLRFEPSPTFTKALETNGWSLAKDKRKEPRPYKPRNTKPRAKQTVEVEVVSVQDEQPQVLRLPGMVS